jgi:MFS family permease
VTPPPAPRRRRGPLLAVLWFVLSAAMLVWPVYPWLGNHVHPRVLGLPWSLVYVLLVIAANFVALLVLYHLRVVDDREPDVPDAPAPAAEPGTDREGAR